MLACCAASFGVAPAGAQTVDAAGPALARLEVVAEPGCATGEDLVARVGARSARIRLSEAAVAGPRLRAEISPRRSGGVSAILTVGGEGGTSRRLNAATCDEAVDALAVMIVVLLDPAAVLAAPAAAPAPAIAAPSAAKIAAPAPRPDTPRSAAPPAARWRFGVGAAAHGTSGPAPRWMGGIALDLRLGRTRDVGRSTWSWTPMVRIALMHDRLDDSAAAGGHASFVLDGVELDLCPLAFSAGRLSGAGCGMALASHLAARGFDTFAPEAHAPFLGALGAAVLLGFRLVRHVELQATLAAGPPLERDAFAFRPAVFFRVAPVILTGGAGLGLTFP